jgi:hypothetical protein
MWADTLLTLERAHLLRLALWGGGSILVGTFVLALLALRRQRAPLLRHFAIQTAAWGAVDFAICVWAWRGLALRDYAGAMRLVNVLWLNVGLDAGYAMVGVVLAIAGWRLGPKPGLIGAGMGVLVQGVALAVLDLVLIARIGPFQ